MNCPKCNARDSRVVDSRITKDGRSIRRRRECQTCGYRFTTSEELVREELSVRKRNGTVEAFERQKIFDGIKRSCQKRPVQIEQINMIVNDIVTSLGSGYEQEIESRKIGEMVMEKLKPIDQIAYVRFASVYREFRDIAEMEQMIKDLKKP